MVINLSSFLKIKNKHSKISDFQDLEHLDGVAISVVNAKLYNPPRDDVVLFYFRENANFASVYTQSSIVSENIKWNREIKSKKIRALLVNTRNANAFTGKNGYQGLKEIAEELWSGCRGRCRPGREHRLVVCRRSRYNISLLRQ